MHDSRSIEVLTARSRGAVSREPMAFVLEFCGNATRAEQITRYVADRWGVRPVEVWVMNYPGYGQSAGPAKLSAIPPAALATYDVLAQRAKGRPIFLAGNSMGTTAALYVAAERPAAGLVLQSPPPLQRLILQHYGWWNLWLLAGPVALQVPGELNSIHNAPRVRAPAVFLLPSRDSLVPSLYQRMVADAYGGEKQLLVLEDADHNSGITGKDERRLQQALDWLWAAAVPDAAHEQPHALLMTKPKLDSASPIRLWCRLCST